MSGDWGTGLCSCMSDLPTCASACVCCCYDLPHHCAASEDRPCNSFDGLMVCLFYPLCAMMTRNQLRTRYDVSGTLAGDICIPLCCHWCALAQQSRFLKSRGVEIYAFFS